MIKNSIEEDIKNLEEIIDLSKEEIEAKDANTTAILNIIDLISLKNLLSEYRRVLKENERYQESDYEAICLENNELSEFVDRIQSEYNDLIKENEKLKDKLLDTLEGRKVIKEETPQYIKENYIPVQKVKDKIEEYKERKAKCNDIETKIRLGIKIRAYEELLEGRK